MKSENAYGKTWAFLFASCFAFGRASIASKIGIVHVAFFTVNMITKDNFKNLLSILNFTESNQVYIKQFDNFELKADFKKQELVYPEDKGLKINERQTCNFSSNENFVVFECVHRLFEKGYNPKHIELEPKWKLGHGASGGRADIWVKNNNDDSLLIIECKTAGKEFENAWKDTLEDGGQLFSYFQQEKSTQFLALYASDFVDDEVKSDYKLIPVRDDMMKLAENKTTLSYEKAKSVKDLFKVWKETYAFISFTNGLFDDNISAYINKKITVADLKEVDNESIIRNTANGANINNLSSTVSEIKIPLPPLDIQKQIVTECEKIDKARNEAQKEIEQLKISIAQTMQNVKSEKKKIGELCEIKKGKSITQKGTKEGNIKVVAGGVNYAYLHNEFNREENTITISASGANAGYVNFWREKIFASDCTTIRAKTDLETTFIYYYLKAIQKQIFSLAKGQAQPHVYPDDIKLLLIPIVSDKEQQRIVSEIEILETQISEAQQIIDSSVEEKRKILEKYL
ncbi:MAG: restriction endonuclease subunit S [Bacteroidales bacterium]|nr:restriction endonuclease subunit S [Bacteroidales bacterium]